MNNSDSNLLTVINEWVRINGGAKILADVIISENHDIYQKQSVSADIRLRKIGIVSNNDIRPFEFKRKSEYKHQAILLMYPYYSYSQIAEELGEPLLYVRNTVSYLIGRGKLDKKPNKAKLWTREENEFIINNARFMNSKKISEYLNRTAYAISNRKTDLGVCLEEKHRGLSGRASHKYNNQS
jgi:hypothetical protein